MTQTCTNIQMHIFAALRHKQIWQRGNFALFPSSYLNRFCLSIKQRAEKFYCRVSTILRRRFHLQNCSQNRLALRTVCYTSNFVNAELWEWDQKSISLESVKHFKLSRKVLCGALVICKCISIPHICRQHSIIRQKKLFLSLQKSSIKCDKHTTKIPQTFVMLKNFRFLHICHVEKFGITPHDRFFLHKHRLWCLWQI